MNTHLVLLRETQKLARETNDSILLNKVNRVIAAEEKKSVIPAAISRATKIVDNLQVFRIETLRYAPQELKSKVQQAEDTMKAVVTDLTAKLTNSDPEDDNDLNPPEDIPEPAPDFE